VVPGTPSETIAKLVERIQAGSKPRAGYILVRGCREKAGRRAAWAPERRGREEKKFFFL